MVNPYLILGYISFDQTAGTIFIAKQNIPRNIEPCPFLIIGQHLRYMYQIVLLDFSHTVKAGTLIFMSGCGSAISSAKERKSGFIYNLVKS